MKRYILRFIPLILVAALTLGGVFIAGSIAQIMFNMSGSENAQALFQTSPDKPFSPDVPDTLSDDFYMLLLGVDSSENRENGDEAALYGGSFRSDSIIVAHISLEEQKIALCSLERDIKVKLEDYQEYGTYNKLNAAYAFGGVDAMKEKAEELIGKKIPYYAVVDMDGLADMIDSVGGIEVDVEDSFYDTMLNAGIDEAGLQTLGGYDALVYSRSRYPWPDGDFARMRHQREVLQALANKALRSSDLFSLYNMAQTVSQNVATNINLSQIYEIAAKMRGIDTSKDMYSMNTPTEGEMDDGISYQILIEDEWEEILDHFVNLTNPEKTQSVDEDENGFDQPSQSKNDLQEAENIIRAGRAGGIQNALSSSASSSSGRSSSSSSSRSSK